MLAESMWQQGTVLPKGWINNNGDLMLPSGALIVAPLLRWFPNGFSLHAFTGVFSAITLLWSLVGLLRALRIQSSLRIFVATMVASGFSLVFAQMVFAQTTYFWWSAGFFVGATLICNYRISDVASKMRWATIGALSVLVFVISFANPGRVLLMMVAPLYGFDWILRRAKNSNSAFDSGWRRWATAIGANDRLTVIGIGLAFALALLIYETLKFAGVTQAAYGAANLYWGGWPSVWKHAVTFFQGWFYYLGATGLADSAPSMFGWASCVLRYSFAIALSGVAVIEVASFRKHDDILRRGMVVAFLAGLVPVLIIFLLFEPLAVDVTSERYFTVPIYIVVVLFACRLRAVPQNCERPLAYALAICGVALVGISAQRFLPMSTFGTAEFWQLKQTSQERLAELLKREGLTWGYATWWNAGATTVLADASVRVTPVELAGNGISRFGYMVLKDWYRPDRWEGVTFLALSRDQASAQRLQMLRLMLGAPVRTVDSPEYRVLVYDRNIAQDFSCGNEISLDRALVRGARAPRLLSAELVAVDGDSYPRLLRVHMRNDADVPIAGTGRYPMSVGTQLLDAEGNVVSADWNHTLLSCSLLPGAEVTMNIMLPAASAGDWRIRVDLVQEQIAWLGDWGVPPLSLPLAVGAKALDTSIRR